MVGLPFLHLGSGEDCSLLLLSDHCFSFLMQNLSCFLVYIPFNDTTSYMFSFLVCIHLPVPLTQASIGQEICEPGASLSLFSLKAFSVCRLSFLSSRNLYSALIIGQALY